MAMRGSQCVGVCLPFFHVWVGSANAWHSRCFLAPGHTHPGGLSQVLAASADNAIFNICLFVSHWDSAISVQYYR